MEDDLNILSNGRGPQYFGEWKTTSIFWKMTDDLNMLRNGRQPQPFIKLKIISTLENDINVLKLVAKLNFA